LARHKFAVLLLAAIALVSSFWFLLDVLGAATKRTQGFGVAAFENRFTDLRKTVQPHAVYGYFSDTPLNNPSALAEFRLTQYTLAPAIIKPTPHENLVVVNYHSKQIDMKLLQANHLGVLQIFGNGVALCRGQKQ
jgi:hypothetical protein